MHKGSFTQFFTQIFNGKERRRLPQVALLVVSSCLLVTMLAIDASASQNGVTALASGSQTRASVLATESSLSQLFGLSHTQSRSSPSTNPTTTTTTATGGGAGGSTTADPTTTGGGAGGSTTTGPTTTTTDPTTTTTDPTTTTTAATDPTPQASGGPITAGDSRSECVVPNIPSGQSGLSAIQSAISSFDSLTNSTVTCLSVYLDSAQTWAQWDTPWVDASQYGYTSWVAQAPQTRQLVIESDLIPGSLQDTSNPTGWEQSCAAGDFNSYATQLGENLVAAGLQNSVIRLGSEANGNWEADYMGTTTAEEGLWASCFDNEVTALRQAAGEHFLIDWNPNACVANVPYANYYPGNAYVDIMGLDFYDQSCETPNTAVSFSNLANEPASLTAFETFANAEGKPMSFPEWGLVSASAGDDPAYVNSIGSTVANGNFAFQSYFDDGDSGTLPLSSATPLSVAAYIKSFGNS